MLDKEAQEMFIHLDESKRDLERRVLNALQDPDLTVDKLITIRKKYLELLEKLQEIEDEINARQQGTEADWLAMWKGQTND